MRTMYACFECASHYLPPESMEYAEVGVAASPVHCSVCKAALAERGIEASPEQVRAALVLARRLNPGAAVGEEKRPDVRPSRPAKTRRSPAPGGRRSKLA